MKYITKDNVKVDVLCPCEWSNQDNLVKFNVCRVELNYMSGSKLYLKNGETCTDNEYIVKYPDGTCHVYNGHLFNILFEDSKYYIVMQKLWTLYNKVEDIINKDDLCFIVPEDYKKYFTRCVKATIHNGEQLIKGINIIESTFAGINLKFDKDIREPYIKINYRR